jgi:hypothetical protein
MILARRPALLLAALALLVVAAATVRPAPAAAARAPVVGIAEQQAAALSDPRLGQLGLRHARLAVPWDALEHEWATHRVDLWAAAAAAGRLEPLVTFTRGVSRARGVPTPAQFRRAVRAFRARYPSVRTFSTWNEANHCGALTCRTPARVAALYRALKAECAGCTVLAADLLDMPNMARWTRAFVKAARVQPKVWGLHNYVTANRLQTARTKELLRTVRGQVWLTETGGLVARRNGSGIRLPQGVSHAAKVTRFILGPLARLSPRISRIYLYHWRSASTTDTWDSAFVGSDGRARPALRELERALTSGRARR